MVIDAYISLNKERLEHEVAHGKSSRDIAAEIGGNARTVRWYMKKYGVVGLRTKVHAPWNKGLSAIVDARVKRSTEAAHSATRGRPAWNRGVKMPPLSNEHKKKLSCALRGKYTRELNANWRGGISPENKRLRRSSAFLEWRKRVFNRDNYTCQKCGLRGGEMHPHHIKPFSKFPDLRFDVTNGQTLCKACHIKTDTWGCRSKKRAAIATW